MIVYLVRHGQTAYNRDGLGLGRADVPLTPLGEQQAAAVGARLATEPITRIFSSPLGRALATARAVGGERAIAIEPRVELLEMDVGHTEGMTFAAMREQHGEFLKEWAGPNGEHACMPGGERIIDVDARLSPFVDELLTLDEAAVAVVSHNFVTKLAICRLLGLPLATFRSFATDVASISTFDVRGGRVMVRALNDICHLNTLEP
ncbi:MAG: histidine phosphatase family protein [Chloroflexi bacterium]|nr:histidine phosphatase family protein [Chloroflexota bacterium]